MNLSDRLPYILLMVFNAAVSAFVAFRAYRSRRKVARAKSFTMMALSGSIWMIFVALDFLCTSLAWREILWSFFPIPILSTLTGLFYFSMEFSLRLKRVPRGVLLSTLIPAGLIFALSLTNSLHHQMWAVSTVDGENIQVMGRYFTIQLVYTYLLAFSSLVLLVRAYLLSTGFLRRQTRLLLIGILIPVMVSIAVDVLGWNPLLFVDEPAFSIVFTVVLFGWATLRFNAFYLLPVALDVIIKNMQDGILITDIDGLIIFSNPGAQRIIGKTSQQMNGLPATEVLKAWLPDAFHAWDMGKEEVQLILGEGDPRYFRFKVSQLADSSGESIGSLMTLNNYTDQKNYEKQLYELAICDPLTGSYNRRYFYEMTHAYFNQMKRSARPLSILMIDLDHFKHVNDTYGHLKGDLLLQKVTAVCKRLVRNQDIFSRYGGEEFILAMPETPLEKALQVAERLRRAVEDIKNEAEGIPVTVSIGVAEGGGEAELTLDVLLNRADEAMYLSKHAGRNCVTAWNIKNPKFDKRFMPG